MRLKDQTTYMATNQRLQLRLCKGSNAKFRNLNTKTLVHKGFTLIELLVVVVILGVLSGIALPGFLNSQKKAIAAANNTEALAQARSCAALVITGDLGTEEAPAIEGCSASGGTFTVNKDSGKATDAIATVDSNGAASLTQTSEAI